MALSALSDMDHHQYHVDILLTLIMVATAVAMATRWIKVPYSIALVLVGLVIGLFRILPPVEMTPELILVCVLPTLLFEAAWNIDLKAVKRDWLPITVLATVGVLLCMFVTAGLLHVIANVSSGPALVFGALIAATDAVSVIAVLKHMNLQGRINTLLEAESLFNDGTSMVLFNVVLAVVASGLPFSLTATMGSFALVSVGGSLLGLLFGIVASKLTSLFDDHLLEITLTVVVAYGSFLLAEQLHVSPVIAVVVAGMVYGNYGSRTGMSPTTRLATRLFWEYAAFAVNSMVFLLIGLQINLDLLIKYKELIGTGILATLLARIVTIYGLCPFVSTRRSPIPDSWRHLLVWGGLRGASCMALALSLPHSFPLREGIIVTTFGVVLFTLVFNGMTMGPLIKLLQLRLPKKENSERFRTLRAQLIAEIEAKETLAKLKQERGISSRNFKLLNQEFSERASQIEDEIDALELADHEIEELELRDTRIRMLELREDCFMRLSHEGILTDDALQTMRQNIHLQIETLSETHDSSKGPQGTSGESGSFIALTASEVDVAPIDRQSPTNGSNSNEENKQIEEVESTKNENSVD